MTAEARRRSELLESGQGSCIGGVVQIGTVDVMQAVEVCVYDSLSSTGIQLS